MDKVNFDECHQLRGHNSEVIWKNWLVIEPDRDIMSMSIVTRFGEDPIIIVYRWKNDIGSISNRYRHFPIGDRSNADGQNVI